MNEYAPRQGYYLIQNIYRGDIEGHDVNIAQALWKESAAESFNNDFIVEVQLRSFERNPILGVDEILNEALITKVIHVKYAARIGEEKVGKFTVDWEIHPSQPLLKLSLDQLNAMSDNESVFNQISSLVVNDYDDFDAYDHGDF